MTAIKLIDFQTAQVTPSLSVVAEERRLAGAPEQSLSNLYQGEDGKLLSGSWSSEAGKWTVDYSNRHEFCYLLAGHIILTDADGESSSFKAGDAFVIPQGFTGSWEVVEPVVKHYVILNTP